MSIATDRLTGAGLTRVFGGLTALDGVDIHIDTGEILGLIGPNGSGKTTLINILSGVDLATNGSLRLAGGSLTRPDARRLARLGVSRTFQNLRLFEQLTVRQNVMIPLLALRRLSVDAAGRRAGELLKRFNLAEFAASSPRALSYGDRRRVELARAVAAAPRFLLLDEPAAGLNEEESAALAARITEIRDDLGCGVLLVEHDLAMVLDTSDRVCALDEGHVVFDGCPSAVSTDEAVLTAYLGDSETPARLPCMTSTTLSDPIFSMRGEP
jgi:ABC-type branched-subunit amino acid transport system ATPase component